MFIRCVGAQGWVSVARVTGAITLPADLGDSEQQCQKKGK